MMEQKRLIGLVGANGSGKSTICSYLEKKGFLVISLSDYIREEADARGLSQERDVLTELSNTLKREEGEAVFAKKAYQKALSDNVSVVAFDSIRHPKECGYLRQMGTRLIGVTASTGARYDRISSRGLERDQVNQEIFEKQDQYERSGQSSGQNIDACLSVCDARLSNDGSLQDLYDQIENLLAVEGPLQ